MDTELLKSRKPTLGKGLGSLLGGDETVTPHQRDLIQKDVAIQAAELHEVSVDLIDTNPRQPRKTFSNSEMEELVESVRQDGIIQPLIVLANSQQKGRYILVAGERRLRAAKLANRRTVPVVVKEIADHQLLRLALIENIQRSDLNIVEEAMAYESLMADHGLTQEECARQVGKDRSSIANAIRILSLPSTVKDDLVNKKLSMGHARALAGLKSEAEVERIRQLIHRKALSVRQTELLCRSLKPGSEAAGKVRDAHPDLEYLAERLRSHLRTKVKLAGNPNRGKIEISFFGSSELERILSAIGYQ